MQLSNPYGGLAACWAEIANLGKLLNLSPQKGGMTNEPRQPSRVWYLSALNVDGALVWLVKPLAWKWQMAVIMIKHELQIQGQLRWTALNERVMCIIQKLHHQGQRRLMEECFQVATWHWNCVLTLSLNRPSSFVETDSHIVSCEQLYILWGLEKKSGTNGPVKYNEPWIVAL